jgi:hypothetical protein
MQQRLAGFKFNSEGKAAFGYAEFSTSRHAIVYAQQQEFF